MSDRPMRLKYLTKMKIILCIFLLCITAVSVFGQLVELHGVVGKSIEFPAAVKIDGSLRYSGVTIGEVTSGRFTRARNEKFSGRLQWDSSTGLLSLSALEMDDSGVYTVQDTQQTSVSTFNLTVWIPVSKPHLSVTHNEYRCTVLCAAVRGTGATLTLYREGEKNPYVSSLVESAPHLHLPVPVDEGGIYTCEAKNSVSRQTSDPLTVGAHCTAPSSSSAGTIAAIIIAVVAVVIVALIAVVLAVLYLRTKTERRDESNLGFIKDDESNLGFIKDVVSRAIQDEANQGLIKKVVSRAIQDEANQGLIKKVASRAILDESNLGFIKDVVKRTLRDEARQGFFNEVVSRAIQDEANQGLIKKVVSRAIQDEASQGLIKKDEASQGLIQGDEASQGLIQGDTGSESKAVGLSFIKPSRGLSKGTDVPNKED